MLRRLYDKSADDSVSEEVAMNPKEEDRIIHLMLHQIWPHIMWTRFLEDQTELSRQVQHYLTRAG